VLQCVAVWCSVLQWRSVCCTPQNHIIMCRPLTRPQGNKNGRRRRLTYQGRADKLHHTFSTHRPRSDPPLHSGDIKNIKQILICGDMKCYHCALLVASRRHDRALIAGLPLPWQDQVWISTEQLVHLQKSNSIKCFVNLIPLNVHVRSNQTQPAFRHRSQPGHDYPTGIFETFPIVWNLHGL